MCIYSLLDNPLAPALTPMEVTIDVKTLCGERE